MKKTFLSFLFLFAMIFSVSLFAGAADATGEIKVLNSAGETVKTYEIVTNNLQSDARDTIQWALNYCRDNAASTDIHTVKLPKGEYCLYSSLNVYSNTVIDLSSCVITRGEGCGSIIRFGRKADTVYGYSGYVNITIKNGTFDGRNIGGSSLVRFAHASNIEISNVIFKNTTDVQHLLTFAASENVRITNCQFLDMKTTKALSGFNCEAVQIDILKEGYFTYPAYDGTGTRNVTVTGCTFSNVPRGLGTHSAIAGHYFDKMTFKNNTFKNTESYAIKAVNYINSEISDNTIIDCGSGISCSTVTNTALSNFYAPLNSGDIIINKVNVKISNNTMTLKSNGADTSAFGIRIQGAEIKNFKDKSGQSFSGDCRISGVIVENNIITSSVSQKNFNGIHIDGALGSEYSKNSDISVKNNKIVFVNNTKSSNTIYGIKLENSEKVYLYGNTVTDEKSNIHSGIVADECESILISTNSVSGAKAFGIKLTAVNKAKVSGNTIENTLSNGIYVYTGSKSVAVTSNKISNCAGYGIAVSDGQVNSIKSNKIFDSGKYGIYITKKSKVKTISSNYICDSGNTGIYLNKTASAATITKNRIDITSKKADGIAVNDKASVSNITNNKINSKTDKASKKLKVKCRHGIRINSSACKIKKISNNTINECDNSGIYIAKAKTKAAVTKNTVKKAKYGVSYVKSKVSVKSNTFKKCSKAKTKILK